MSTFNSPFRFANGVALKNRLVLAPMTNSQSHEDGSLSDAELRWLARRAEGGFGMIISAASHVQPNARAWAGQLGCFADAHVPGLKKLAALGKQHGCATILQLFHGGVRCPRNLTGVQPTAPSVVTLDFPNFETPRALEEREIEEIIANFVAAGVRAHEAGLTGIEVHGANGYLFTQFLSQAMNHRADRWGGSLENRARFLIETVTRLRAKLPADFIIGVRLLPEDAAATKGFDIDETLRVVQWLSKLGVDYIHVSAADVAAKPWKYAGEPETILHRFRTVLPADVTLMACGGVKVPAQADFALAEGADLVALGKIAISTPSWPTEADRPGFKPGNLPMTHAEAAAVAISPTFATLLEHYGLVKPGA